MLNVLLPRHATLCNVLYNRKIRAGFYKEVLRILQSEEELELEVWGDAGPTQHEHIHIQRS